MQTLDGKLDRDGGRKQARRSLAANLLPAVFLGSLALLGWRYSAPPTAIGGTTFNSSSDWDSAFEQSRSTGKPALAVFTAGWCPTCRRFGQEGLADPRVQQYVRDNHTLIVCDLTDPTGANAARARQLGVSSVPMLILFDSSGREKARAVGMPADSLMTWLKSGGMEMGSIDSP